MRDLIRSAPMDGQFIIVEDEDGHSVVAYWSATSKGWRGLHGRAIGIRPTHWWPTQPPAEHGQLRQRATWRGTYSVLSGRRRGLLAIIGVLLVAIAAVAVLAAARGVHEKGASPALAWIQSRSKSNAETRPTLF